ncbi:MAG: hypothetical protein QNK04_07935 [Myxococcota bacterium]|nr:hypothetical protein [Myxococcota bacterium]
MERIDCIGDPIALLWGLVLAHVAGASSVLAVLGALLAIGARLPEMWVLAIPSRPVRTRWRVFPAPQSSAAAA